ncbi:MAG TPA: antitoxin [Bacteroidetes bacterium]|nr:antitoxin [Bacteroidota bacterium]
MKALSIRGVDEQLSTLLKQQAKASQSSVNQFVLETLRKHVGLEKDKRFTKKYDDLDSLFGKWSKSEFDQIQGKVDDERRIDEEHWK